MKLLIASILFSLSFISQAVDVPTVDIMNQQSTQEKCVDTNTNACINDSCLLSEDIDCQDKCKTKAASLCQGQQIE